MNSGFAYAVISSPLLSDIRLLEHLIIYITFQSEIIEVSQPEIRNQSERILTTAPAATTKIAKTSITFHAKPLRPVLTSSPR